MTDKQLALETLGHLPETASWREITGELLAVTAIRQGRDDMAAGRVHSHEEVERLFTSWTQRWTTKDQPTG